MLLSYYMKKNNKYSAKLQKKADQLAKTILALCEDSYDQGVMALNDAIKEHGDDANLVNRLGAECFRSGNYDLALRCFQYVVAKVPEHYSALNYLGSTLQNLGLGLDAANAYRQSLHYNPNFLPTLACYGLSLLYYGQTGRHEILRAQKNTAISAFSSSTKFVDDGEPVSLSRTRRLNVGFVSSDLREHAVGHFMLGILSSMNRENYAVHVFDNGAENADPTTSLMRSLDVSWHSINSKPTAGACKMITRKNIDILIDLNGHTAGSRQDVFSNRVAPVQAIYLGYPCSSGMPNIDFRIGDTFCDLEEFDEQNTEKMVRLPFAMWNYHPWSTMPNNNPQKFPFEKNGYITFGSANNHAKLQPEWLMLWAKVLEKIPNSRLIIKSQGVRNVEIAARIRQIFGARVDLDRIELRHYSSTPEDHWREVSGFDIALDSYPYNGTTTTCDMLWLGVPVVTCTGSSHLSRTTGSILTTLNLSDWVSSDEDDFINLCIRKAADLESLALLKKQLRSRMQQSTLIDSKAFVPEFDKALRLMWDTFCDNSVA
ncbi:MAG: protein O-GlcNAc transferase [Gammaproteobacteria bacterium]